MVNVVTSEARSVAREIEDQLEARDVQGIGLLALMGATGVIVVQEVTERVLPLLNMPREPTSGVQFAASGAIKIAYALVVGVVAAQMSGIALVALAFHAVGAVVFAGADFVNAIQRTGLLAEASRGGVPQGQAQPSGGSGNRPRPASNAGSSRSLLESTA